MTRRKQKSIFQAIAELRAAWKPAARKLAELRTSSHPRPRRRGVVPLARSARDIGQNYWLF